MASRLHSPGVSERAGRPGWMRARHSASAAGCSPARQASLVHQRALIGAFCPTGCGGWPGGRQPGSGPRGRRRSASARRDGARCARTAAGPGSAPPNRQRGGAGRLYGSRRVARTHSRSFPVGEKPCPESRGGGSFPRRSAQLPRSARTSSVPRPGRCGCGRLGADDVRAAEPASGSSRNLHLWKFGHLGSKAPLATAEETIHGRPGQEDTPKSFPHLKGLKGISDGSWSPIQALRGLRQPDQQADRDSLRAGQGGPGPRANPPAPR